MVAVFSGGAWTLDHHFMMEEYSFTKELKMIAANLPSSSEGALVWVNHAGRVRVNVVRTVFTALGLAKCLPRREKRAIALRLAIKAWLLTRYGRKDARTMRLYPLDRRVLGFEVRRKIDGVEQNEHPYVCTVKADDKGAHVTYDGQPGPQQESDDVTRVYLDRVEWYCPTTVGSLLKRAITEHWLGTSLKSNGGLYFVPGQCVPYYRALADGLERGPANPDSELVMTVATFDVSNNPGVARDAIASLRAEIAAATAEINADLLGSHEMTGPGLANRKARLANLIAMANEYADLFGTSLDDAKAMAEATSNALAMAELSEVSA